MYFRIALVGKAGSGKTTLAKYLEVKYHCLRRSFAKPIYDIAKEYFGMEGKNRTLLQQIGTKMREIDKNVWVNYLTKHLDNFKYSVVIDDCRFKNEYTTLKYKNFVIIKIIGRQWKMSKKQKNHPSEKEMESIKADYVLDNSGELSKTLMNLDKIMEEISHE